MMRRVSIALMVLTMLSTLMTSVPATVFAANVGNTAPYPPNSQPTFPSLSTKGEHVFFIRKNPTAGLQKDIRFSAYLPAGANIAGARLLLNPGTSSTATNVCEMNGPLGDNNRAIRVIIREPTSGATAEYYIRLANVCARANQNNVPGVPGTPGVGANVLYARYPFPNSTPPIEVKTNMHRFDVTIEYGTSTPPDAGGIRIVTSIPSNPSALISPGTHGGSQVYAFPTVGDWDDIDPSVPGNPKGVHDMTVPFGLCETSNTPETKRIGLYDADNGPSSAFAPAIVRFKVRDLTTNTWVRFNNGSNEWAQLEDGNETVRPADGTNDEYSSAEFDLIPSHFYEMQITRINLVNTIDVQIPQGSQSIWGDPNACQLLPPPPAYDQVTLESGISHNGDVEVGGSVTFNQNVAVSNFPVAPSQWGFNEEAIRVAWNTNTAPVQTPYAAREVGATGQNGAAERKCENGWAANCGRYVCDNGSLRFAATGCGAGVGGYRWRCVWNGGGGAVRYRPANAVGESGYGWIGQQSAPGCPIYQYQCRDTAGNWQNQYRNFVNRENEPGCQNQWNCWAPSGRPNTYDPSYGAGYCRVFRCAYDPNPANYFYSPPGNNADDQCDRRCNGGTGARAPNWNPPSSLDDNCYIQPSFTVTCTFDNGVSVSEVVNNNGTYCDGFANSSTTKQGLIRGQLCAVTTAASSGWQGTPPGKGVNGDVNQMRVIWNFNVITPASTCAQVGQRPYFHVYGGDVNANTAFVNPVTSQCDTFNSTTIQAFNNGGGTYIGSGSQLAAIARGIIDGFTSASISTERPFGLTFANTTGGWGGSYQGTVDCIPDTTIPAYGGSNILGPTTVSAGNTWLNFGNQDVHIIGDILYSPTFSFAAMPSFKVVTRGNIYIGSNVQQVNGTYIAHGKIFTCAVGNGAGGLRPPSAQEMEDNCESQLRVNGSFVANQVKLLRIVGSAGYAPFDPRSGSGLGTPAELFLYTPNNWMLDLATPPPTPNDAPIDSILNLPPIL